MTEAEYVTLTHTAKEALWLCTFLSKIGAALLGGVKVNCDNQGMITLLKVNKFHARIKHINLVQTMTTVTAKGVAWIVLKEVVRLHGIPESIVSDRDAWFTSIFWRELQKLMGTKLLMSTVFHPQTDGATERANRSIAQILHQQKDLSIIIEYI